MVNERVRNAFKATSALGIPVEEVKPILKNLLKVFDMNWDPIEAEDYRTLLDAYFDSKENNNNNNKVIKGESDGPIKNGESNRPSNKLHVEHPKDQFSFTIGDRIQTIAEEVEGGRSMPPGEGNNSISRRVLRSGNKQPVVETGSSCIPGNNTKQIAEQNTIELAESADVTAVVHPAGILEGSPGNNFPSHLPSQYDASGSGSNGSASSESNLVVAASSLKEVKILLNCDYAIGQQNFQIPDLSAVLKSLEDRYQRDDKLVTPQFSVTTLLKDLCESYLKLGTVENSLAVRKIGNSQSKKRAQRNGNSNTILKERASKCSRFSNSPRGTNPGNEKRPFLKLSDISKGSENVKISLVNETGNEEPPKFTYMPHNIIYQNACLQISLARIADEACCSGCSGDCLSSPIPCECARETGGEFAYTQQGLLKQEFLSACESMKRDPEKHNPVFCQDCPLERSKNEYMPEKCKGHLVRKFIKECWRKCGCDMNCGNRVVQRGITCNLEVFMTGKGKGWGLRPLEDLPKGSFVCEYVGEILTNMELYDRNMLSNGNERHTYPVTLDADWGSERVLRDEEALCLDATFSGNVARFINHRCEDANLIDIPVEVETPDRHYYHLAFFTTRKVSALEELTWDYGIDFDDNDHPIKAFRCCCGSALCRDKVKGDRRGISTTSKSDRNGKK